MIEPIFAQTKFNRRCDRFQRRGRAACRISASTRRIAARSLRRSPRRAITYVAPPERRPPITTPARPKIAAVMHKD
jgi:hypothetical protein